MSDVGGDEESPVADNKVAEETSATVVPEPSEHLTARSSRGPVDLGVTPAVQIASAWAWPMKRASLTRPSRK